jgi:hypothetical protein
MHVAWAAIASGSVATVASGSGRWLPPSRSLNIGNRGGALLALAFVVAAQPAHRLIAFVAVALLSAYYRPLGRTAVSSRPLEEGSPA